MRRPYLILDIETRPDPNLDDAYWEARGRELQAPSNYKDPDKIANYQRDELQKLRERAALSPLTGCISVIGVEAVGFARLSFGDPEAWGVQSIADDDIKGENELLAAFSHWLGALDDHAVVGFNIASFDLPFLFARAAMNDIDLDLPSPSNWRNVGELRSVLHEGQLYQWMRAFGAKDTPKPDYSTFPTVSEQIHKCSSDLAGTRVIARRLEPALDCLRVKS